MIQFKAMQGTAHKDVERSFVVLQMRASQLWYHVYMRVVMYACISLHNMIIEDAEVGATNWSNENESSSSSIRF